jgi:hypothetical protein
MALVDSTAWLVRTLYALSMHVRWSRRAKVVSWKLYEVGLLRYLGAGIGGMFMVVWFRAGMV